MRQKRRMVTFGDRNVDARQKRETYVKVIKYEIWILLFSHLFYLRWQFVGFRLTESDIVEYYEYLYDER